MTDFQRYLRAKQTVDDRALDRRLLDRLREALSDRAAAADGPLSVLEVGAGIGTMVSRLIEWDVLPAGDIEYTAVDVQRENVDAVAEHLRTWAADRPVTVADAGADGGGALVLRGPDRRVTVEAVADDGVAYAERAAANGADDGGQGPYDLLIGAAMLDILDLDGLDALLSALDAGGLWYFPITFDGATRFRPGHPADRAIERRYHAHMDRKAGGSSRAGGDTLERLRGFDGASVLGVAGSDWIVRPVEDAYPGDEAYFLGHILDTVESAVGEIADDDFEELEPWLERRRAQLDAAELVYHTHQLDFLGRVEEPAVLRTG